MAGKQIDHPFWQHSSSSPTRRKNRKTNS